MKVIIKIVLILNAVIIYNSCNSVEPPPPNGEKPTLLLKLEDVSCTEAWIKLETTNLQLPATVTLKQFNPTGDTKSQIINLNTKDSLLYIDSLLPKTSYQYRVSSIEYKVSSSNLSVTTMDTTSHDFTFETFTFGGTAGSSTLYDVAIVGEEIWAVGEIYVADTSINGYTTYNAVHWDGSQWELKRITVDFRGNLITPPLEGVFSFSNTDIWFVGSLPIHGDGENWIMYDLRTTVDPNITVSRAWGSSSNDMYFVGRNGNIARYLNGTWSKINSGTNLNINDIWGTFDNEGNQYILCTAYNFATGGEKKLLRIRNFVVDVIPWVDNRELYTVWFNSKNKIYAGGEGLFNLTNGNWTEEQLPPYFIFSVRGDNHNNILAVGGFGFCSHFNGISWKTFDELAISGNYKSVAVKGGLVTIIGTTSGNKAIIVIGQQ